MTAQDTAALPHWDMSVVYPGLDSPEYAEGFAALARQIADLGDLYDRHGVGKQQADEPRADSLVLDEVLQRTNAVLEASNTLRAYIYSFVSTNSRDALAQAKMSEFQQIQMRLSQLGTRLTAWIGGLDVAALTESSQTARDHAFMLQKATEQAAHLMDPALEELSVELGLTGSSAWNRLYSTFTSQLIVPMEQAGRTEELPMSAVRNLAFDERREVRKAAYEAELATWRRSAVPIAAAMNSIKGEVITLTRRRGWSTPLDEALFDNNIDRQTLDAMLDAARESFPDFRRYLKAKAQALGTGTLPWYDMFAPLGGGETTWSYDEAARFIGEHFGSFSPRLRGLAERAFGERWIDAEPRDGKVGGAFCMALRNGESRVLTNYKMAFGAVSTLAHELGHAYHNMNLAGRRPLQRSTPMTLAETASIFCETIVVQAALATVGREEQIGILEASLQDSCQVVVDISSRVLFEQQVFERRAAREQSADELCALMLDAQRQTYGDGLDADTLHPYMWAAKPHYYGRSFYNFPYMFGLLFGLGLYARYQSDPEEFKGGYDDLLSSTGLGDAATLAKRFDIDIRSSDFWRSSLDVIRGNIDRFEKLVV